MNPFNQLVNRVEGVAREGGRAIDGVHQEGARMMGRGVLTTPLQTVIRDQEGRERAVDRDTRSLGGLSVQASAQIKEFGELGDRLKEHTEKSKVREGVSGKLIEIMEKDSGIEARVRSHFDEKVPVLVEEVTKRLAQIERELKGDRTTDEERGKWEKEKSELQAQLLGLQRSARNLKAKVKTLEGLRQKKIGVELATRNDLAGKKNNALDALRNEQVLRRGLEEDLKDARAMYEAMRNELSSCKAERNRGERAAMACRQENKALDRSLRAIEEDRAEIVRDMTVRVDDLEEEVSEVTGELKDATAREQLWHSRFEKEQEERSSEYLQGLRRISELAVTLKECEKEWGWERQSRKEAEKKIASTEAMAEGRKGTIKRLHGGLKRSRADNDDLQGQVKRLRIEKDDQSSLAKKNLDDAVVAGLEASRWEIDASKLMDEVRGLKEVRQEEQVNATNIGQMLRKQIDDLQQDSRESGWGALFWEAEAAGFEAGKQKSEAEVVRVNKVGAGLKKQNDDLQEECAGKGWEALHLGAELRRVGDAASKLRKQKDELQGSASVSAWEALYLGGELSRVEAAKQVSDAELRRVDGVGRGLRKQKDDLQECASVSAWEALHWEFEARRIEASKVEDLAKAVRKLDGRTVQMSVQIEGLKEQVQDKTWEAAHFEAQSKQVSGFLTGAQKELAVVRDELSVERASKLAEHARYEQAAKNGAEWHSKATERAVDVEKLTERVGVLEGDIQARESDVDRLNACLGDVQQKLDGVQKEKRSLEERLDMLAPAMQGLDLDEFRGVQCRGEEWLGRVPGMVREADLDLEVIILKMIKGQQIELLELVVLVQGMGKYVELALAAVLSYVKDKRRGLVAVRCVELLKLHGKEGVVVDVESELERKLLQGGALVLEEAVTVSDCGVVVNGVFWWADRVEMVQHGGKYALVGEGLSQPLTFKLAAQVEKRLPSLWQKCKLRGW